MARRKVRYIWQVDISLTSCFDTGGIDLLYLAHEWLDTAITGEKHE